MATSIKWKGTEYRSYKELFDQHYFNVSYSTFISLMRKHNDVDEVILAINNKQLLNTEDAKLERLLDNIDELCHRYKIKNKADFISKIEFYKDEKKAIKAYNEDNDIKPTKKTVNNKQANKLKEKISVENALETNYTVILTPGAKRLAGISPDKKVELEGIDSKIKISRLLKFHLKPDGYGKLLSIMRKDSADNLGERVGKALVLLGVFNADLKSNESYTDIALYCLYKIYTRRG